MKNTHFKPCAEINYHSNFCPHNIVIFTDGTILLKKVTENEFSPIISNKFLCGINCEKVLEIGTFFNSSCGVIELSAKSFSPGEFFEVRPIRDSLKLVKNQDEITAISRAVEFSHWLNKKSYCSNCGEPLTSAEKETAKLCKKCQNRFYPVLAPAVIVAITRGNQILLAHNHRFKEGMYSLIAGFVETGENLEQAVKREVFEEVGLEVKKIQYFSSQSWPFPNSLMMGFTAEYESGEITIDTKELADAQWFDMDNLPFIPTDETIARRIIDHVIKKKI